MVRRAVADLLVMLFVVLFVVMRGGERGRGECEQTGEKEEGLHNGQDGTEVCRLSLVFC
jgi:hypothetical protein